MNSLSLRKKEIKACDHKKTHYLKSDHKNFSTYLNYFEFVIALKKSIQIEEKKSRRKSKSKKKKAERKN